MNAFIKTDIENAVILMKAANMNALHAIENGEEKVIRFETSIPLQLIIKCAEERGWEEDMEDWDWTNGWQVDYWYYMKFSNKNIRLMISGSLLEGNTKLITENNE
jgi:hypothetical protein